MGYYVWYINKYHQDIVSLYENNFMGHLPNIHNLMVVLLCVCQDMYHDPFYFPVYRLNFLNKITWLRSECYANSILCRLSLSIYTINCHKTKLQYNNIFYDKNFNIVQKFFQITGHLWYMLLNLPCCYLLDYHEYSDLHLVVLFLVWHSHNQPDQLYIRSKGMLRMVQ